jgi:hypothetical protein
MTPFLEALQDTGLCETQMGDYGDGYQDENRPERFRPVTRSEDYR